MTLETKTTRFGYAVDLCGDEREISWDRNKRRLVVHDLNHAEARRLLAYLMRFDQMAELAAVAAERGKGPEEPRRSVVPASHPERAAESRVSSPPCVPRSSIFARTETAGPVMSTQEPTPGTVDTKTSQVVDVLLEIADVVDKQLLEDEEKDVENSAPLISPSHTPPPPKRRPGRPKGSKNSSRRTTRKNTAEKPAETPSEVAVEIATEQVATAMDTLGDLAAKLPDAPAVPTLTPEQIADLAAKGAAVTAAVADAKNAAAGRPKSSTKRQPPPVVEVSYAIGDEYEGVKIVQASVESMAAGPVWLLLLDDGSQRLINMKGELVQSIPAEPPVIKATKPKAPKSKVTAPVEEKPAEEETKPDAPTDPEDGDTDAADEGTGVECIPGTDTPIPPEDIRKSSEFRGAVGWLVANDKRHQPEPDQPLLLKQLRDLKQELACTRYCRADRVGQRIVNALMLIDGAG